MAYTSCGIISGGVRILKNEESLPTEPAERVIKRIEFLRKLSEEYVQELLKDRKVSLPSDLTPTEKGYATRLIIEGLIRGFSEISPEFRKHLDDSDLEDFTPEQLERIRQIEARKSKPEKS